MPVCHCRPNWDTTVNRGINMKLAIIFSILSFTLLCGALLAEELPGNPSEYLLVEVSNPLELARNSETIAVNFSDVTNLKNISTDNVAVYSLEKQAFLSTQTYRTEGKTELLFQAKFSPGQVKQFAIMEKPANMKKIELKLSTFAGFYPRRDDDIAWENDKMAARMYGKGLEWETISCGIDLWCKEVDFPILEKKYSDYLDKGISYHDSNGLGGDYYKVGPTLGCGGSSIFKNGKLYMPEHNFTSHRILANGPIRSVFEIDYPAWDADGIVVSETMRISVDLGSYLCKVEAIFKSDQNELPVAAGIITRETGGQIASDPNAGWLGYWQPKEAFGTICGGIVVPETHQAKTALAQDHALLTTKVSAGKPFTYYTGGTWDKTGDITSFDIWKQYLEKSAKTINNPLKITLKRTVRSN